MWIAGSGQGDDQLLNFTSEADFVMQVGRANRSTGNTDAANVNRAADVYVYPQMNEPFVADGYGNRRVIVFDGETGAFRRIWGTSGDPPADPVAGEVADEPNPEHFDLVHGVRVSNDGQVYVSDRAGMRLQVFSIEGEYIRQLMMGRTEPVAERVRETAHGRPVAELIGNVATVHQSVSRTAFSPDAEQRYLFVAERSNQQVVLLETETLRTLTHFGWVGDRPGEFYILHDMVSDPDGDLYTAEVNVGARAQKFANTWMTPAGSM